MFLAKGFSFLSKFLSFLFLTFYTKTDKKFWVEEVVDILTFFLNLVGKNLAFYY